MMPEVAHSDHVAPEEQPVEPRPVVHDDQTRAIETLLVTTDLHPHPKHQLCKKLLLKSIASAQINQNSLCTVLKPTEQSLQKE